MQKKLISKKNKLSFLTFTIILVLTVGLGVLFYGSKAVSADTKIKNDEEYNTPSYIIEKWESPNELSKNEIVQDYMNEKFSGVKGTFTILEKKMDDQTGKDYFRLQQEYKGIPVYGADQTLSMDENNNITSYFGTVIPDLNDDKVDTNVQISKRNIIEIAKKSIEKRIGKVEYDAKVEAEPYIYEYEGEFYNTYLVTASTSEPKVGYWHYFIDSNNGEVVDYFNASEDITAFGKGVFGEKRKFEALRIDSRYALQDITRGQGVKTFDATDDDNLELVTSINKMFNDGASVDAHANAQKTYDYYERTFDRDSVDDEGQPLLSRVHVGDNWNNASWNGVYMSYGDGDGEKFHNLAAGQDVAAHEMTHGVVQHTANLEYRDLPGALNESYADIFGTMVQRENWLIGEDIMADGTHALRSLEDPASLIESRTEKPYPDHWSKRYTGNLDNGGVHINSSINNKAAYLVSEGGEHYGIEVEGVGRGKTEQIYYHALDNYLTSNSDFSMMKEAATQSAQDLYGEDSEAKEAVKQAYNAVGVE